MMPTAGATIVKENSNAFCLLMLCWVLTPITYKLNLLRRKQPDRTTRYRYLAGALNAMCFISALVAMTIAYVPNPVVLAICWLLVLGYACSFALSQGDHPLLAKLNAVGLTFGFMVIPFVALWLYSGLILARTVIFFGDGFGHLIPGCLYCFFCDSTTVHSVTYGAPTPRVQAADLRINSCIHHAHGWDSVECDWKHHPTG
jgi:hypothetical protein